MKTFNIRNAKHHIDIKKDYKGAHCLKNPEFTKIRN